MAQLVASMSGVVLGGVVKVVGSSLTRGKIVYAVGSVDVRCSASRSCQGRGFESH